MHKLLEILHSNRWFIWTIVACLVVGVLVWWQVMLYSLDQEIASKWAPEPHRKVATLEIDTTGWKTYRNEKYGFEFKYPNGWVTHLSSIYLFSADFVNNNNGVEGEGLLFIKTVPRTTKEEFIKEALSRIQTELSFPHCSDCSYGGPPTDPELIYFQGLEAIKQTQMSESGDTVFITIPQKGVQVEYGYTVYYDAPLIESVFKTFKFFEPTAP